MQAKFSIQTPNLNNMKANVEEGMKKVLWRSMTKMEKLAKNKAPVDTGMLKNRIHLEPMQYGAREYTLVDGVKYGIDLEYGNRPHHVDMAPLIAWVKRKGIKTTEGGQIAFAKYVQEKIRTKGVNAQPFFRNSLHEVQYRCVPIFKNEVFGKQ
jgi:hypothetical protein